MLECLQVEERCRSLQPLLPGGIVWCASAAVCVRACVRAAAAAAAAAEFGLWWNRGDISWRVTVASSVTLDGESPCFSFICGV